MPPPRPDFVPPNHLRRHRPLDPTRQLTSRDLWNQVRFHSTTESGSGDKISRSGEYYQKLTKAILYEVQPFRIKPTLRRIRFFLQEEDGLQNSFQYCIERIKSISMFLLHCVHIIYQFAKSIDFKSIRTFVESKFFRYSISSIIGLYSYGCVLKYLHEWLHAGPMVFILTLLVLLYTIGLGEDTGAAAGMPSAYSVFNRGVQRLLGQDDAERLANQFVNAMAGRGMNVAAAAERNVRGLGQVWVGNEEIEQNDFVDEQEAVNERRRRRRLERLQQRNSGNYQANEAQDMQRNREEGDENINHYLDNEHEEELPQTEQHRNAAARKSGKKGRRRNLEIRREMQRQRQAAAAIGFRGDGLNEDMNMMEMNAIDQLIDD